MVPAVRQRLPRVHGFCSRVPGVRPGRRGVTVRCYVCGQPAVCQVTVTHTGGGVTRYAACDTHEPRHIPQGNAAVICTEPIH